MAHAIIATVTRRVTAKRAIGLTCGGVSGAVGTYFAAPILA